LGNGVESRIRLVATDLLDAFSERPFADLIVSNPPYISERELSGLQREVRDWEPRIALTDFGDGLEFYRRLLNDAPARLKPGGHLICEMGYNQSERIIDLIGTTAWSRHHLLHDLQGIARTIVLQRRG
jgi:release factor glutamine methyltransferase